MEWGFVHELWKELAWALRDLASDLPASSWGGHHPLLFWRTSSNVYTRVRTCTLAQPRPPPPQV